VDPKSLNHKKIEQPNYGAVNYENLIKRRKSGKLYKSILSPSNKNYAQILADRSYADGNRSAILSPD